MMSADPAALRAAGFEPTIWQGQETYVKPGEFILSLGEVGARRGDAPGQLAAVNALLGRLAGQTGATATRHLGADGLVLLSAPADAAFEGLQRALQRLPGFEFLEPNFVISATATPNDTHFAKLWGLNNTGQAYNGTTAGTSGVDIDAPEAWDTVTGSMNTVIGVLDSGADHTHVDLHRNVWINQGEIPASVDRSGSDVDSDGLLTFRDLNDPRNAGLVVDANANGYVDGADLLQPVAAGGWADYDGAVSATTGVDNDGNGYRNDLIGWDFKNNDNNPLDDQGHGTHVAGTIGATGNDGAGVTGVNWNVQVMPLKVLGADLSGVVSDSVRALNYASSLKLDSGVSLKATNNSYGGGPYSQAMYNAVRDNGSADVLFVAAAGNGDWRGRAVNTDKTMFYPAGYGYNGKVFDDPATSTVEKYPSLENVVAVTATNSKDAKASFANYGAKSVDLGAPGVDVYSLAMNGGYKFNTGTSMAAPHVAGAIGLAASLSPTATAAQLKDAIVNSESVDLISSMSTTTSSKGRLDANKAVGRIKAVAPVAPVAPTGLAGVAASSSQIDLKWNDVSGETGYRIERASVDATTGVVGPYAALSDASSGAPVTMAANATTYSDRDLAPASTYSYRVYAFNSAGNSPYSAPAQATTKAEGAAPNAPSGLTAVPTSASQVNLAWVDNSADETGFELQRSTDPGFPAGATTSYAVGPDVTTFADAGLAGITSYHYRVRATGAGSPSAFSNTSSATTLGTGTGLRGDYYDNMLSESTTDANAYSLGGYKFSRTDSTVDFTTWGSGAPSHAGVTLGGDSFTVRWSGMVQPRFSDDYVFRFEPDDGVGMWITGDFDGNGTPEKRSLWTPTWDRYDGTSYNGTSTEYANTTPYESDDDASVPPLSLKAGVKYPIEIVYYEYSGGASAKLMWRSTNKSGTGDYQPEEVVPATQLYYGPTELTARPSAASPAAVDLTWADNSADEDAFQVERSADGGATWQLVASDVAPNSGTYTDASGLTAEATYAYRVRAYDGGPTFSSAYSNTADAQASAGVTAVVATYSSLPAAPATPFSLTAIARSNSGHGVLASIEAGADRDELASI